MAKGGKASRDNPKSIVEGFRQVVQDLLVPELKALQVRMENLEAELKEHRKQTAEQFAALRKEMEERFAKVDERFAKVDEQFVRVWQVLNRLLEAQQQTQTALQRILDRMDVTEALRDAQTRQQVLEERTEHLHEQVQHLRGLMELLLRQRGIQPPSMP